MSKTLWQVGDLVHPQKEDSDEAATGTPVVVTIVQPKSANAKGDDRQWYGVTGTSTSYPESQLRPVGLLSSALWYASQGVHIIPVNYLVNGACSCGDSSCVTSSCKHPLTSNGGKSGTTNPTVIRGWWAVWPNANIGGCLGMSGFVGIDIDNKNGKSGSLDIMKLQRMHPFAESNVRQLTPTGGEHWVYNTNGAKFTDGHGGLPSSVDVRGQDNSYILLEPSQTPAGVYIWDAAAHIFDHEPMGIPDELAALLVKVGDEDDVVAYDFTGSLPDVSNLAAVLDSLNPPNVLELFQDITMDPNVTVKNMGKDSRSEVDQSVIVRLLSNGATPELVRAIFTEYAIGQKFREKGRQGRNYLGLSITRAQAFLKDDAPAAIDLDALLDEVERQQSSAARRKKLWGFAAALTRCDVLEQEEYISAVAGRGLMPKVAFRAALKSADKVAGDQATDDVLRDRWIDKHSPTAFAFGRWHRYNGAGMWPEVPDPVVKAEIADVVEGAKKESVVPTSNRVDSIYNLAYAKLYQPEDQWNQDPDILVMNNGTLEISTRTLREHKADDYATTGVDYDYDPGAAAPNYQAALNTTIPDEAEFFMEFMGYSLTPDTKYEIALWKVGLPGGGKSTILNGPKAALGSRCGTLGLANIERSNFHLTALEGRTLMIATEQPSGLITRTSLLNTIISGEALVVEQKYKDPYEITPVCKLAWAMNEQPAVKNPGDGVFRRVKILVYPPIPESQQDKDLKDKVAQEQAGILNMMLDGLDRLRARGHFAIPDRVKQDTQAWFDESDKVGGFVRDACDAQQDKKLRPFTEVAAGKLMVAFRLWCRDNGYQALGAAKLKNNMARLGFGHIVRSEGSFYVGLTLKNEFAMRADAYSQGIHTASGYTMSSGLPF